MCSSVLVIVDGVLVAVVLSVWILVLSALDSNCVVVGISSIRVRSG